MHVLHYSAASRRVSQPAIRIGGARSREFGEGGRERNHADRAGHDFLRRRPGPERRPRATSRKTCADRRFVVGAISVCLSESRHAEIARHDRGASAAGQVHGHAAAARQPQRAGTNEARFEWRCVLEIAGAHSHDHPRRFPAHFVYRGISGRERSRFRGAMRFRDGGEARLDGRV